jgi:fibronectin type 3 domain-containing protein
MREGFASLKCLEHEKVKPQTRRNASFGFCSSLFVPLLVIGCGAPGEPTPRTPPIPVAITDLAAHQAGDAVQLSFSVPAKTIAGEPLTEPPAVEVLRGSLRPDGSPDTKSFRVVATIPGALVGNYRSEDRVQFPVPVTNEEIRAHPGDTFVYRVRTRASRKRASADSNTVSVRVFAVAERITSLQAKVTETAIELSWQAPTRTSAGEPLTAISEYRIYRGELDTASADAAAKDISQAKWKSPLTLLAASPTNSYRDTLFDFGKTYLYVARTVMASTSDAIESSDSNPAIVTPRDNFPPAVPQGLVAAVIVGSPTNAPEVDLSWSINLETDLAGYHVYRSEQEGTLGRLVTPDLLLSPAYRDTSVQPGHRYWYSVTSVDRSGNESAPCAPVAAGITQPSS